MSSLPHRPMPPPEDIFDRLLQDILTNQSPHAYSTFGYFQRLINQFHLSNVLEPYDICLEAYLRGKIALRRNKVIINPPAWLKTTGYNIIREKHRQLAEQHPIDPQIVDCLPIQTEIIINDKLDALMEALQQLKTADREAAELIELHFIEGMSWEEVRQHLLQSKIKVPDIDALRQRGCRAMRHLRRLFHEVTA